jgi:transcriptional regulator with XRE-family HTH domain
MTSFGGRLRARGRQLKMSETQIAKHLGLNRACYTNYVNGQGERDFALLLRLCRVLRISPNELLGYDSRAAGPRTTRHYLQRIATAVPVLTPKSLKMVASIIDATATHQDEWTRRLKGSKPD